MRGTNVIEANEATIIAAVQHYFDTIVFKDAGNVKVTSVKSDYDSYFKITISEEKST